MSFAVITKRGLPGRFRAYILDAHGCRHAESENTWPSWSSAARAAVERYLSGEG